MAASLNAVPQSGAGAQLVLQMRRNLLPVEAPVLNEYLIRPRSRHNHSRHINSRHVTLQRDRIADRTALLLGKFNSRRPQKVIIRMIPSQREDKIILDADLAVRRLQLD